MHNTLIYSFSKKEVFAQDLRGIEYKLNNLALKGKKSWSTLSLTFDGYEDDPRELMEIEEVRAFARKLVNKYPYIFCYFSNVLISEILLLELISNEITIIKLEPKKTIKDYWDEENYHRSSYSNVCVLFNVSIEDRQKLYLGILAYAKRLRANLRGEEVIKRIQSNFLNTYAYQKSELSVNNRKVQTFLFLKTIFRLIGD